MALYDERRDPPLDPIDPSTPRTPLWVGNVIPIVLAAAVALLVIAMLLPASTPNRVGDTTNTSPTVQTVTPAPSPSTEPRPTQAPQP